MLTSFTSNARVGGGRPFCFDFAILTRDMVMVVSHRMRIDDKGTVSKMLLRGRHHRAHTNVTLGGSDHAVRTAGLGCDASCTRVTGSGGNSLILVSTNTGVLDFGNSISWFSSSLAFPDRFLRLWFFTISTARVMNARMIFWNGGVSF
ncbi:hypothetical protein SCLCIDRAFT_423098 [Scleroderma citrinum Foug A]|uniref:Uncharacterized protein n=1 Tax=Scleroderma citrinum Foug A TaxID=1036808 RepID=A0A0C3EDC1_9AGAM|nr:hypothetical protein SCLCIDRAFT_423098 [Scleroderma citrinum Foug A]